MTDDDKTIVFIVSKPEEKDPGEKKPLSLEEDKNEPPKIVLNLETTGVIDIAKIYEKNFEAKENSKFVEKPAIQPIDNDHKKLKGDSISSPDSEEIVLRFEKTETFDLAALADKKKKETYEIFSEPKDKSVVKEIKLNIEKDPSTVQTIKLGQMNNSEDNEIYTEKIEMVSLKSQPEKKEKKLSLDTGYPRNIKKKEKAKAAVPEPKPFVPIELKDEPTSITPASPNDIVLKFDKTENRRLESRDLSDVKVSEKKLVLDLRGVNANAHYSQSPKPKTASQATRKKVKSGIEYGSLFKRLMAQIIDSIVALIVFVLSAFLVPFIDKTAKDFMDMFHLQFSFSNSTTSVIIHALVFALDIFIVFALFLSYTNTSIGKKPFGLSVRGKYHYEISVSQAALRELVFKPISILSVVGVLWAFLDKEKRTLHDILSATYVIVTEQEEE